MGVEGGDGGGLRSEVRSSHTGNTNARRMCDGSGSERERSVGYERGFAAVLIARALECAGAGDGDSDAACGCDCCCGCCLRRARRPEGLASVGEGGGDTEEKGSNKFAVDITGTSACEGACGCTDTCVGSALMGGDGWRPCLPRTEDVLEALLARGSQHFSLHPGANSNLPESEHLVLVALRMRTAASRRRGRCRRLELHLCLSGHRLHLDKRRRTDHLVRLGRFRSGFRMALRGRRRRAVRLLDGE